MVLKIYVNISVQLKILVSCYVSLYLIMFSLNEILFEKINFLYVKRLSSACGSTESQSLAIFLH